MTTAWTYPELDPKSTTMQFPEVDDDEEVKVALSGTSHAMEASLGALRTQYSSSVVREWTSRFPVMVGKAVAAVVSSVMLYTRR